MSHSTTPLLTLLRLLLAHLVSSRESSWPTGVQHASHHAHGMLDAARVLGHISREQHARLERLIYSAASNRNRELSLRQHPYGRRFPVGRAAA